MTVFWSTRRPVTKDFSTGLSSGDGSDYPLVEVAATAAGNDRGEGLDLRDD